MDWKQRLFKKETLHSLQSTDQILKTIKEDNAVDYLKQLIKLYLQEDLEGMYAMFNSEEYLKVDFKEKVLDYRNKKWVESGLLSLLQEKGLTITPVF